MVGERYRDLIEAADTIQNMKQTAPKESPNQPYLAVAASIKLLMVVPERI